LGNNDRNFVWNFNHQNSYIYISAGRRAGGQAGRKVFWWTRARLGSPTSLHNKRVRPSKNEPQQQGISYLEREREGVREAEGWGSRSSIFKVRLGLGEIEGRERADNKNPEQNDDQKLEVPLYAIT
jgi:hypothetical protein